MKLILFILLLLYFNNIFLIKGECITENNIVTSLNNGLIQPYYLEINYGKSGEFNIPLNLPPIKDTLINLLIMIDVTCKDTTVLSRYQNLSNDFQQLKETLSLQYNNISYGLSTFSDSLEYTSPFKLETIFKNDISDELNAIQFIIGKPVKNLPFNSIIKSCQQTAWTKDSVKVIILITDNDIEPDTLSLTQASNQIIKTNSLIGILSTSSNVTDNTSFNSLINTLSYGISKSYNSSTLSDFFVSILNTRLITIDSDKSNLVISKPINNNPQKPNNYTSIISVDLSTLKYLYPFISYKIIGYNYQNIYLDIQHLPIVPSSSILSLNLYQSDINYRLNIPCFDLDSVNDSIIEFKFNNLPSIEFIVILDSSNNSVSLENIYQCNDIFYIQQNSIGNEVIEILVFDDCLQNNSSITSLNITVLEIEKQITPSCEYNTIYLNDIESDFFIQNLVNTSTTAIQFKNLYNLGQYGKLLIDDIEVTETDVFQSPISLIKFKSYLNVNFNTTVILPYQIRNINIKDNQEEEGLVNLCFITLNLIFTSTLSLPILEFHSPQYSVSYQIKTLPYIIMSSKGQVTITVTEIGPGLFYDFKMDPITELPHTLANYIFGESDNYYSFSSFINFNGTSSSTLSYIKIQYKHIEFNITGPIQTIDINIENSSLIQPPSLNPNNLVISVNQTQESEQVILRTDSNAGWLFFEILPVYGVLFNVVTMKSYNINNIEYMVPPITLIYRPLYGWTGSDILVFGAYNNDTGLYSQYHGHVHFIISPLENSSPQLVVPEQVECYDNTLQIISLVGFDLDLNSTLSITILTLPNIGQLLFDNYSAIESVPVTFTNQSNIILYYDSPTSMEYINYSCNFTSQICDEESLCSEISLISIQHNSTQIERDLYNNFSFKVFSEIDNYLFRIDNSTTEIKFSKPLFGAIYYSGDEVQYETYIKYNQSSDSSFIYVANSNLTNSFNITNDFIFYQSNLYNGISTITIEIIPFSLNYNSDLGDFVIDENDQLIIPINNNFISNLNITITKLINGTLSIWENTNIDDNSTISLITSFPFTTILRDDGKTVLLYQPSLNENGYHYSSLKYNGTINGIPPHSSPGQLTSYITVTPVNSLSILTPDSYINDNVVIPITNNDIFITVNTPVTIVWNGTDLEDGNSVSSKISILPLVGTLYQYNTKTIINNTSTGIFRSGSDQMFKVTYVPVQDQIGFNVTSFSMVIVDSDQGESSQFIITVNILPLNAPPVITIPTRSYKDYENSTISILGVSFDDSDSFLEDLTFNLVIQGDNFKKGDLLDVYGTQSFQDCYYLTPINITCTAPKNYLNSYLSKITVYLQNQGDYQLQLTVIDSGRPPFRSTPSLSDKDFITITMLEIEATNDDNDYDDEKNDKIIIATVSSVGGVAFLVVLLLIVYLFVIARRRRLRPVIPRNPYADESMGDVRINPLYKSPIKQSYNPLYKERF